MLDFISNKSTCLLMRKNSIEEEDKELYMYGFYIIYSTLFIILSITAISCFIFNDIIYSFLYIIVFIPVRAFAGGYHSNSYFGCFSISNVLFIIATFLTIFLNNKPVLMQFILLLFFSLYICWNQHSEKKEEPEFTREEHNKFHRNVTILCIFWYFVFGILQYFTRNSGMIVSAMLIVAIMIHIKNRKEKNHDSSF
ncbi:accessory gene regulator B family protein [Anaerocolumna sp. AGMB13020]|uniref:accessory gene regulator B family protein n=1 Tax=Anaerocolumna sp. AGMB13020 TaxID=3081750 RepID=UPI003FA406DC